MTRAASHAVERTDAGVEHGKAQGDDLAAVADIAVTNAADGTVAFGDGAHQLAPGGVRAREIGGMDGDVAGAERVHHLDLETVRVRLSTT